MSSTVCGAVGGVKSRLGVLTWCVVQDGATPLDLAEECEDEEAKQATVVLKVSVCVGWRCT